MSALPSILLRPKKLFGAKLPWLLLCLLAACHSELSDPLQSGKVLAWEGLEGRWVGPVAPTTANCGPTTLGLMSIGEKGFGFDPFQSTSVIDGDVSADGHLHGSLTRQSSDRHDLSITFAGSTEGRDAINGILQSGRCRWTVTLHRG